jgi:hypothetical protein
MNKLLKQHWPAIVIISFLLLVIVGVVFYLTNKIEKVKQDSEDLVLYNQQMGELFISFQEKILSQSLINQSRDLFMIYSMNIITKHYIQYKSSAYKEMTSNEIITFLDEIYKNSTIANINPFIPLAFACVETDFRNDAVGLDGERSVFQFMETTARETYRKLNLPYLDNWWKDPKEIVRVWFAYYQELSNNFISPDPEQTIRWTALAYNVGLYRNRMKYHFSIGTHIDVFVNTLYYHKGNRDYNKEVYNTFMEYNKGFERGETL